VKEKGDLRVPETARAETQVMCQGAWDSRRNQKGSEGGQKIGT